MQRRVLMSWLKAGRGENLEETGHSFGDLTPILTQVDSHSQQSLKKNRI